MLMMLTLLALLFFAEFFFFWCYNIIIIMMCFLLSTKSHLCNTMNMMWNCNHFINWDLHDNTGVLSSEYVRCTYMKQTPWCIPRRYMTSNETWKFQVATSNRTIWCIWLCLGVRCLNNLVHLWFFVAICLWFPIASTMFQNHIFLSNSSL